MPPRTKAPTKSAPKKPAAPTTLTPVPNAGPPTLDDVLDNGTLLGVLNEAVGQMTWLKPSDAAMVALCQRYAGAIDTAVGLSVAIDVIMPALLELAEETDSKSLMKRLQELERLANVSKVVGWIGPQLANALRDIGGTPGERKGLEADAPVKNKLEALRGGRAQAGKPPTS